MAMPIAPSLPSSLTRLSFAALPLKSPCVPAFLQQGAFLVQGIWRHQARDPKDWAIAQDRRTHARSNGGGYGGRRGIGWVSRRIDG